MRSKHTAHFEVEDALAEAGCPICALADRSVRRFLETLFYEQVNDPGLRSRLLASRGFCRTHTGRVLEIGNPLGISLLYRDLLAQARASLEANQPFAKKRKAAPCTACAVAEESATRYLSALVDLLAAPESRDCYRASEGLCLPHLEAACPMASPEAARFLIGVERDRLARLEQALSEIIRKHDYRFQGEPWGDAVHAWRQAPRKLTGGRSQPM